MFTATVSVAVEDFALPHALGEAPGMAVRADRLAAHSRHWVMPCLWTTGGDFEAFDAALRDDPTVAEVVSEVAYKHEKFYQIHWSEDVKGYFDATLDAHASLLHAETTNGDWRLVVRFGSRDQFDVFRDYLSEEGIAFSLENLTQTRSPQHLSGGLTASQREALVAAVAEGYFAIPRDATMDDVADALGISTQAASERLRRGIEEFVATTLVADDAELER